MKIGFIIGRFQVPNGPHSGHLSLFRSILEENDVLGILVGSANRAPSIKNPYSYKERAKWIEKAIKRMDFKNKKVFIYPINDYLYNDSQWLSDAHSIFTDIAETVNGMHEPFNKKTLRLYGHFKKGNDYLNWFPAMEFVNLKANDVEISGTSIRKEFKHLLPLSVREDMEYYEEEALKYINYPYPETLNLSTSDSVVECLGHVLLIKRKFTPGKDMYALPGGFKNKNETFLQAALRELNEETNIRVPEKVLMGSIKNMRLFDHPGRSSGVPRHTLAVHFHISPNPDGSLPRANGGDDASETNWVPIAEALNSYPLFDDHQDIISEMLGARPMPAVNKFGYISFNL